MLKTFLKVAAATAFAATSAASFAAPVLTNSAGTFTNWGGFDWASNGTAVAVGYNSAMPVNGTDTFDMTYWSKATSILDTAGVTIDDATAGLLASGGYEYTVIATFQEKATCNANNGFACTNATFEVIGGTFQIYYGLTKNANQVTGAGITDGILLISGSISAQPGGAFDVIAGGNAVLNGTISYTNSTYIQPDLTSSIAATTLQIGGNVTGWVAPTSLPAAAGGTSALPAGTIQLQADANQTFATSVPEPDSLALAGFALLAVGATARRVKRNRQA